MNAEMIINNEDRELISILINELFKNGIPEETDFCESGGIGVKVEYIEEDSDEICLSVYRYIYITRLTYKEANKIIKKKQSVQEE